MQLFTGDGRASADRRGRRVAVQGFAALRAAPERRLVTRGSAETALGGPRRRRGAARCPRSFSLHSGAGGAVSSPRTPALLLALLARSFRARRTYSSARRQPTEAMAATAAAAQTAVKCQVPVEPRPAVGPLLPRASDSPALHAPARTPRAPNKGHHSLTGCHTMFTQRIIYLLSLFEFRMFCEAPGTYRTRGPGTRTEYVPYTFLPAYQAA